MAKVEIKKKEEPKVKEITLEELRVKEGADSVSVFDNNMWKTHVKGYKIYDEVKVKPSAKYWVNRKGKKEEKVF